MSEKNDDATHGEASLPVDKFPEHLMDCPDLFEFSYEEFVKIGRKFRSANDILAHIDGFTEEIYNSEQQEENHEILSALEDEKQIIRFSIFTKNNVIVI